MCVRNCSSTMDGVNASLAGAKSWPAFLTLPPSMAVADMRVHGCAGTGLLDGFLIIKYIAVCGFLVFLLLHFDASAPARAYLRPVPCIPYGHLKIAAMDGVNARFAGAKSWPAFLICPRSLTGTQKLLLHF